MTLTSELELELSVRMTQHTKYLHQNII